MRNIFTGMLLVFLDFHLDIGPVRIGFIPDFLGYIFMLRGLGELYGYSERFTKISPFVKGMIIYTAILYAVDLFGLSYSIGVYPGYALGLASTIISLYISYCIVMGIKDIEILRMQNLNSEKLYSTWRLLAVFSLINYVLILIPIQAVFIISVIVSVIIGIYYLVIFNRTKNLYYQNIA